VLLTKEEQGMLDGEQGPAVQKAIEIVVALGKIYDAENLVPITSVQVAGVSYKNLGEAGIDFLNQWANDGAKVCVKTTLNPAGMDLTNWKELGFAEDFAKNQLRVIDAFKKMGIPPSCSCTPYLTGNVPLFKDHIAWSESSAVSFANSVIGARTNREGGPSAIAAALTGRIANFGLHLDKNRLGQYVVKVECDVKDISDFGALGYIVGSAVKNKVPYFKGITGNSDQLKSFGASMAAAGAVALYHIEGVTPEAKVQQMWQDNAEEIVVDSLSQGYDALNSDVSEIDFVSIGCPHASITELKEIAKLVEGKILKAVLWVTTAKKTRDLAVQMGLIKTIEQAGGKVLSDTCMVVAPVEHFGFKNLATNTGKGAKYAPSHCNLNTRFGNLEKCIQAAVTGRWEK